MCLFTLTFMLCGLLGSNVQSTAKESTPEVRMAKSLMAISDNRLDLAMNEVETLLSTTPNYKLAQLVKGDLLMAKAGLITRFGSAPNASGEAIQDMRDEARVRLQRTLDTSHNKLIPSNLWQLNAEQKYALVVDTSRSTLYVYENINGKPRYLTDFYVTIGKLGTEKEVRGDKRTPIGVYFVQSYMPKKQLADLYGDGAFPLNYPNEWDRKNARTGDGIWLHGTPSDTYSRPPRASNGCVVLTNEDLNKLAPYLQVGITPVIITNQIDWIRSNNSADRDALLQEIEHWRNDWAQLNTDAYLKHYDKDFTSGKSNYAAWAKQKQSVNAGKSWAKVDISNVSLFTYPEQPGMIVVDFEQDYRSNNLSNRIKKRQYWIKKDNHWKIIYEGTT